MRNTFVAPLFALAVTGAALPCARGQQSDPASNPSTYNVKESGWIFVWTDPPTRGIELTPVPDVRDLDDRLRRSRVNRAPFLEMEARAGQTITVQWTHGPDAAAVPRSIHFEEFPEDREIAVDYKKKIESLNVAAPGFSNDVTTILTSIDEQFQKDGRISYSIARALVVLARNALSPGAYEEGKEINSKLIEWWKRYGSSLPELHPVLLQARSNLMKNRINIAVQRQPADRDELLKLKSEQERIIANYRTIALEANRYLLEARLSLAVVLRKLNEFVPMEELLGNIIAVVKESKEPRTSDVLLYAANELAILQQKQLKPLGEIGKELRTSIEWYEEFPEDSKMNESLRESIHVTYANAICTCAELLIQADDLHEAAKFANEDLLEKLKTSERIQKFNPALRRRVLTVCARLYACLGDCERALELYQKALEEIPNHDSPGKNQVTAREVAEHYFRIGTMLTRMGRDKEAITKHETALKELAADPRKSDDIVRLRLDILLDMLHGLSATNRKGEFDATLDKAREIIKESFLIKEQPYLKALLAKWGGDWNELDKCIQEIRSSVRFQSGFQDPFLLDAETALVKLVHEKGAEPGIQARVRKELTNHIFDSIGKIARSRSLRERESRAISLESALNSLLDTVNPSGLGKDEAEHQGRTMLFLIDAVTGAKPDQKDAPSAPTPKQSDVDAWFDQLQKRVGHGNTLLTFWMSSRSPWERGMFAPSPHSTKNPERLHFFVLRDGILKWMSFDEETTARLREEVKDRKSPLVTLDKFQEKILSKFLSDASNDILSDASKKPTLYLFHQDIFRLIGWGAVKPTSSKGNKLLIDHFASIEEVTSLADIGGTELAHRRVALRGEMLAVLYGVDLPWLENEEKKLKVSAEKLNCKLTILSGDDATIQNVLKHIALERASGRYRYIHIGAHATAWSGRSLPPSSESITSQIQAEKSSMLHGYSHFRNSTIALRDGALTGDCIASLNLEGVECVFLSCCEAGISELRGGQDYASLQRAFLQAGAKAVVASRDRVMDRCVPKFVENFYENLAKDPHSYGDALRGAQKAIRSDPDFPDHGAWAAWLVGARR